MRINVPNELTVPMAVDYLSMILEKLSATEIAEAMEKLAEKRGVCRRCWHDCGGFCDYRTGE